MKVDKKLIEDVAKNARLELTEKEIEEFSHELKDVLEAFSKLEEINTDNEEEAFHPIKIVNRFREDKVNNCLSQEEALKNAKHKRDGYFLAPKTIEK
jgi:aspartyl-tRNA(Asn)/glutamyl-tRNA(Gln) amidotransferase subunit C